MPAIVSHARALDRVIGICGNATDATSMRVRVLEEIRRTIAFNAHAWLLTDPETEVGCAPFADAPCLADLPRLIWLKYLTPVNRWTGLGAPVALLSGATGGRLEQSRVWREMLADYDVTDVASLVFRNRFGCWGFLDLWRMGGGTFTDAEAHLLTAIARPVSDALQRCQAATFDLVSTASDRRGPVVLVLSPELEVQAQTPETDEYLRQLVPPGTDRQPIPAGAYNVAAQLLAVEAGIDDHPPSARVHLSGGVWLTLRAARIGGAATAGVQDIAVTIEPTAPSERMDLFARACGLSARESELLGHVSQGCDTHGVAQRMFVSENTVQDHLKSIFAKTGVTNRRSLLVRALGP